MALLTWHGCWPARLGWHTLRRLMVAGTAGLSNTQLSPLSHGAEKPGGDSVVLAKQSRVRVMHHRRCPDQDRPRHDSLATPLTRAGAPGT
jgi:hypothetical protein